MRGLRRAYKVLGFRGTVGLVVPATFLVWSLFAPAGQRGDLLAAAFGLAALNAANVASTWAIRRRELRRLDRPLDERR